MARRLLALSVIAFLGWASVVDNPAVCPDEMGQHGDMGHGTPPSSHCCLTGPCHTPTALRAAAPLPAPARPALAGIPIDARILTSADVPAPPTPPPTALD